MIKAVFFDIDGTLVSFRTHVVPPSTRYAIAQLRERGVKTIVATGRSPYLIDNIDRKDFDAFLTFNGQYCYAGGRTIYSRPIPRVDIENAIDFFKGNPMSCAFVGVDFWSLNRIDSQTLEAARLVDFHLPEPSGMDGLSQKDIYQLIAFCSPDREHPLLRRMPGCAGTRWTSLFTDVIPVGGGKHVGMERIAEWYGLRRDEIMAFGDGENDISMLHYAGTGVAMGNADNEVKEAADFVTTGVDDEGIPNALRHFGLIV